MINNYLSTEISTAQKTMWFQIWSISLPTTIEDFLVYTSPPLQKFQFSIILFFKNFAFAPSPLEFPLTLSGGGMIFFGTTQYLFSTTYNVNFTVWLEDQTNSLKVTYKVFLYTCYSHFMIIQTFRLPSSVNISLFLLSVRVQQKRTGLTFEFKCVSSKLE